MSYGAAGSGGEQEALWVRRMGGFDNLMMYHFRGGDGWGLWGVTGLSFFIFWKKVIRFSLSFWGDNGLWTVGFVGGDPRTMFVFWEIFPTRLLAVEMSAVHNFS